jgi:hypothetical protein
MSFQTRRALLSARALGFRRWLLLGCYVLSAPVEPFVQLHLLVLAQRENAGPSKRIIDVGQGQPDTTSYVIQRSLFCMISEFIWHPM